MGAAFNAGVEVELEKLARGPVDANDATKVMNLKKPRGPSSTEKASWAAHRDRVMKDIKGKRQVIDSPRVPKKNIARSAGKKGFKKGLAAGAGLAGLGALGVAGLAARRRKAREQQG